MGVRWLNISGEGGRNRGEEEGGGGVEEATLSSLHWIKTKWGPKILNLITLKHDNNYYAKFIFARQNF